MRTQSLVDSLADSTRRLRPDPALLVYSAGAGVGVVGAAVLVSNTVDRPDFFGRGVVVLIVVGGLTGLSALIADPVIDQSRRRVKALRAAFRGDVRQ